ncbi:hypothetical protein D3C76_1587650 [compost metagenome]
MSIFGMLPGVHFVQAQQDIVFHIRVCIFVDGYTRRRMWTVDEHRPILHPATLDNLLHFPCDILHFVSYGSGYILLV